MAGLGGIFKSVLGLIKRNPGKTALAATGVAAATAVRTEGDQLLPGLTANVEAGVAKEAKDAVDENIDAAAPELSGLRQFFEKLGKLFAALLNKLIPGMGDALMSEDNGKDGSDGSSGGLGRLAQRYEGEQTFSRRAMHKVQDLFGDRSKGSKVDYMFDYFSTHGWSKAQAAGIIANISWESNFKEHAVGDGGSAYGIGQWHSDRQADFARAFGKDIHNSTFEEQVAFVDWELKNTESAAGNRLKGAGNAYDAAGIVCDYYERPQERVQNKINRGNVAQGVLHGHEQRETEKLAGATSPVGQASVPFTMLPPNQDAPQIALADANLRQVSYSGAMPRTFARFSSAPTIVIDPGHGGAVPDHGHAMGAHIAGVDEADLNLVASRALAEALREKGYNVVMTRDDRTSSNPDRDAKGSATVMGDWRTRPRGDMYVSLHHDSVDSERGGHFSALHNADPASRELAGEFASAMRGGTDYRPNLSVLHERHHQGRPAVLLELGNMRNHEDLAAAMDPAKVKAKAERLAAVVDTHFRAAQDAQPQPGMMVASKESKGQDGPREKEKAPATTKGQSPKLAATAPPAPQASPPVG